MYELFPIILIILILFLILNRCRKKQIICRISHMSPAEKCNLLNRLAEPFGFCYDIKQDVFSTRIDAWQKTFGYGRMYDLAAPSMNMVLDTEPVYFNYQKKTWLIQFWKGQYGITAGAEAGIYHADSIVPPMLRGQTLFQAAEESEMLPMRIRLLSCGKQLFCFSKVHWWLTGFLIGKWFSPSDLTAEYTITFPDPEMCGAFLTSLTGLGYNWYEIDLEGTTLRFTFSAPRSPNAPICPDWRRNCSLWIDRLFCKIYRKLTRPFSDTADRLLYLYYYLPYIFRRTICPRTFTKRDHKKHRSEKNTSQIRTFPKNTSGKNLYKNCADERHTSTYDRR